jgi:hypothetical protein
MAVTATAGFLAPDSARATFAGRLRANSRRHTTPQAGRALEILGHAIEYLADEFVHEGGLLSARDGRVQAVQLLMALNRQVYFECPVTPASGERWRTFLRSHLPWLRPRDAFKVAEIPRRFHAGHSLEGMPL